MRGPVLLLAGGMMAAVAHAQSGGASSGGTQIEFLPMPNTLPLVFFAPDSLAGTYLEPFALPESGGPLEAAGTAPQPEMAPDAEEELAVAATDETVTEPVSLVQAQAETGPETAPDAVPEAGGNDTAVETPPEEEPAAEPPAPTFSTVHIIVENVQTDRGRVNVAVCDTGLSEEGCPYHTSVPATVGFVEAVIDDIPPGVYAVVGYHDVNNNDEFDKFLSMPREPYALSGAAADALIPDFSDAALDINAGENYVIIRLKRLGEG